MQTMTASIEAPAPVVTLPALLTPSTLATLGGLATAVVIIVDSVHSATGWTSSWFGFVLALILSLVVEFTLSQASVDRPRVARLALALINGCLVFTTALGGNQVGNRVVDASQPTPRLAQPTITLHPSASASRTADRPFFHDWLQ
jgi:hypothetical protein